MKEKRKPLDYILNGTITGEQSNNINSVGCWDPQTQSQNHSH